MSKVKAPRIPEVSISVKETQSVNDYFLSGRLLKSSHARSITTDSTGISFTVRELRIESPQDTARSCLRVSAWIVVTVSSKTYWLVTSL